MSNEKTAEEILSAFISEIKREFSDQNWDYLDFIADRVAAQFLQPAPDRIDKLLKLQIDECSNHIQRCARDKGQASYEMEEWIKSTPLIDYHKQPAPDNFAHVSEQKSGEEWLRQPHLKDMEQPAPQENIHPESYCHICNGKNTVWYAENELFNKINGSEQGIMCPSCFERMAEGKGENIIFVGMTIDDSLSFKEYKKQLTN